MPLRGVIHAAGVLDDGVLHQLSWERFSRVLRPKVAGAWHLHTLTATIPLEFFVFFSSGTALLGAPGQANHAAANTFLDALAHYRRSSGLPALSINWGPWAQVGAAAERNIGGRVKDKGIELIPPRKGLEALELLLGQSAAQVGVVPIVWDQFRNTVAGECFFEALAGTATQGLEHQNDFLTDFQSVSRPRRNQLLQDHVRFQVMKVLGLNPDAQIDLDQSLLSGGMDSLASVELRNHLQASLGIQLPSTWVYDYPTVERMADFYSRGWSPTDTTLERSQPVHTSEAPIPKLDVLSESELSALLEEELQNLDTLGQNARDNDRSSR